MSMYCFGVSRTLLSEVNTYARRICIDHTAIDHTAICQKSTTSSADAIEKWLEVHENGSNELRVYVKNRMAKSNVLNLVTMTANYFHPLYRGQRLDEQQLQEVKNYIFEELDAAELESWRQFTTDSNVFASMKRKKITAPNTFWHCASETGHEKLSTFAMKYLKIPASTAQLERLFSNWAYIHNDIRNRLSSDTSKKLVNVYFTLRSADNIDTDSDLEIDE